MITITSVKLILKFHKTKTIINNAIQLIPSKKKYTFIQSTNNFNKKKKNFYQFYSNLNEMKKNKK